ncbi:unnamed protein product [Larinioides sclopetarius]|uniref:Uncharacterized protein n=1 Tax=Larinioides sclopetarius TaxID=280406 RepID=A0AAV1ZNG8_9ARAC
MFMLEFYSPSFHYVLRYIAWRSNEKFDYPFICFRNDEYLSKLPKKHLKRHRHYQLALLFIDMNSTFNF